MTPRRILLADDHSLFREGLAGLVNGQPDLAVVAEAADGLEALEYARRLRPDLIVMDIQMPVCDGLEATRRIRQEWSEARILILTVHEEEDHLFEAVKAGATGYFLKHARSAEFLAAVRACLAGQPAIEPRLASRLLAEFARLAGGAGSSGSADPGVELTRREEGILRLLASGARDKEIAARLSISLHTVKTHVRSILAKLHAVNRHHAARLAEARGMIPPVRGA